MRHGPKSITGLGGPASMRGPIAGVCKRLGTSKIYADFSLDQYAISGQAVAISELLSVVNSAGYALRTTGAVYDSFPSDSPRATNRGLLVEPEATNILTYSNTPSNSAWTNTSVSFAANVADPALGVTANTVIEGGSGAVLRRTSTTSVTSGATYVLSKIVKRGNADWVRLGVARETGLTNQSRAWFDISSGVKGTYSDAGSGCGYVAHGIISLGSGWYCIYLVFSPPVSAVCPFVMSAASNGSTNRANVGSGAGVGVTRVDWNTQLELLPADGLPSSPIITTNAPAVRLADAVTLEIPSGVKVINVTFDDGAVKQVSVSGGNYVIPTNYARRYIKKISSEGVQPQFSNSGVYLVSDYVDGDPNWTNNTPGLSRLLRDAVVGGSASVNIPTGSYGFDGDVSLYQTGLTSVSFSPENDPVEFVFTANSPSVGGQLHLGVPDLSGSQISVSGDITLRHKRPAIRTGNCDMLLLNGMSEYSVDGVKITSADNMALTIGRGDPNDTIVDSVYVGNTTLGGYVSPEGLNSHGTVGDSCIWLLTPGLVTVLENNVGTKCGDDFIFIGHNTSSTACDIEVRNNSGEIVSGGISTSFKNVKILDNYIRSTLNVGIGFITDSELGNGYVADGGVSERNVVEEAGFFTAAAADASTTIPQVNPFAFWFRGSNITSTDDTVRRCLNRAVVIQPPSGSTQTNLTISGMTIEQSGCSDASGTLAPYSVARGVIHRSAASSGTVDGVTISAHINGTKQSLVEWLPIGTSIDQNITINLTVENIDLGSNPAVYVNATGTARAYLTVNITVLDGSVISVPKAVSGGATSPSDVTVNIL